MSDSRDPNPTVDDLSDSLDAGLAAGFGRPAQAPRSGLDASQRPVLLREAEGESDHIVKPNSDAMPDREESGDRYQLFGEIARGGMGAVLRGRDVDLGRDLAIKVLLEKHAHRPEVARRFLEEAQIGGQLQHPGVVPVYDIGRFGERPFFTMKLVKGKTLAALLSERGQPTEDLPRLLVILHQVSQALAYAHAKGVIHRDLKPANVMVGAFGEVQVMDWGLAKVLAEGGIADEQKASRLHQEEGTQIRTARSTGSSGFGSDTEAGTLLGTPAYMPPEQANGDIANLDRRADVFGLGAILCEILTGKPPYVGRSGEEVRRKAANGALADAIARLDCCGADAELVVLAKACLSPEASDRPKDAREVAEALTTYLDGVQERLRKAELAEAEAKARAVEETKRRKLTLALAATVLLAVGLGAGGWIWVKTDRDARMARVTRDVNDALNKATGFREQARTAPVGSAALLALAREQEQRALALVENGPADDDLKEQVRMLQAELDEEEKDRQLLSDLDEARMAQADFGEDRNSWNRERAVPLFRKALRNYGLPAGEGNSVEVAVRLRQRPHRVRETVLSALDEWISLADNPRFAITEPHRDWLQTVLVAIEPEDGWTRRFRAAREEKDKAKRRADLAALAKSADVMKLPAPALTHLAGQLPPLQAAELLRRGQRIYPADFWVNHNLGWVLQQVTPPERGESVRFLTVAVALRPESTGCRLNLGNALRNLGKVDEAIVCYHKAIALDPKYAAAHTSLGLALKFKGKVNEAILCHRKAIELDSKLAVAHSNLGVALLSKGKVDDAIGCYKTAIDLAPKFATPHLNLGIALEGKGKVDEAIRCYRKAIELNPKDAIAHASLGNSLRDQGRVDDAIACYRKAIEIDPTNAMIELNLGVALAGKGKVEDAIRCYRQAIKVDPNYATAHMNLGLVLYSKGKVDEAILSLRKAIDIDPRFALAHSNLGTAFQSKGHHDDAIECFKQAIAIDSTLAVAHYNLGVVLTAKGKVEEAILCYRKAIEFAPKYAAAHLNLGIALEGKGKVDDAINCYRKAIDIDSRDAIALTRLGYALAGKGKLDDAIACYEKAIEHDPKLADAHGALGFVLLLKGRYAEARVTLIRAQAMLPKSTPMRAEVTRLLQECARLLKLEARLPGIVRGEDQPASALEFQDLAQMCAQKQMNAGAARLWVRAFVAVPRLAGDLNAQHRYSASCAAALAAAGNGVDAPKLESKDRITLRRQALTWLRADLTAYAKLLTSGPPAARPIVQQRLQHWKKDADLAGIRDKAALEKLPAEERAACVRLWADVAALLKKAETPSKQEAKP